MDASAETLSDHQYLLYSLDAGLRLCKSRVAFPRWNLGNFDKELFEEVINIRLACFDLGEDINAERRARWLTSTIVMACDCAARRVRSRWLDGSKYWWNEDIAAARKVCMKAKRRLTRYRKRRGLSDSEELLEAYRDARRHLRSLIKRAKLDSWNELIRGIKENPWGLPYKIVMGKLGRSAPGLTEELDPVRLTRLLDSLFPRGETHCPGDIWGDMDRPGDLEEVSPHEVEMALKKGNPKKTPGPDGVTLGILRRVPSALIVFIAETFSGCLREGTFPSVWKRARLVFIPKAVSRGSSDDLRARPICLLNELGKLFKRIIVERINKYMDETPSASLSDRQFGFQRQRSTVDALDTVMSNIYYWTNKGYFAMSVSLDVRNAFNSIPWPTIRNALTTKGFPVYIRKIIDSYLHNRSIVYPIKDGGIGSRDVSCGVPLGSVLGPLLWNIAFDYIIQVRPDSQCTVICYADDTLVLAAGSTVLDARSRANNQVAAVCRRIGILGLTIAPEKTDAVLHYGRVRPTIDPVIKIDKTYICMKGHMRYLGVILDSRMTFLPHFRGVRDKVAAVTRSLFRLMPNLRGPSEGKRRLYAAVIGSVVLYGAPIWAEALLESSEALKIIREIQRRVACRVCSAYRTVSRDAALLLARLPPYELVAEERMNVYVRCLALRNVNEWSLEALRSVKKEERIKMQDKWIESYRRRDVAGVRTRDAILPNVDAWMSRGWGGISFHMTQLLTGHGCFGTYLNRIERRPDSSCWHCSRGCDSPEHTLEWCPA